MNQIQHYDKTLVNISPKEWPTFLKEHAYLPDGTINEELAQAFAETATLMDFKRYMGMDHHDAPANSQEEFLTFCGVLGYGVYLSRYFDSGLLSELRARASDPREHVRQAVVLALTYIGRQNIQRLLNYLDNWIDGAPLEQKAAIATLREPSFLKKPEVALMLVDLLDWATASITDEKSWNSDYDILQNELEQAWALAVIALPSKAKMMVERWMKVDKPVVSGVLKKNLEQPILKEAEPVWTSTMLKQISKAK
ncbi:MAG: HEAT repeat domain-containing protein [Bacteroidota bacterium]